MNNIDLYDLYTRKCDLESLKEALDDAHTKIEDLQGDAEATEDDRLDAESELDDALSGFGDDEAKELEAIEELERDIGELTRHGGSLIHESNFEDYARQLAEDIGAIDRNASWPLHCIDWRQAAEELKQEYTCVTFDGEDYFHRE
jgi:hypothetical protein